MVKLTPRLSLVASLVNKCEKFLDVGTDHAYLPAYLIENNIADFSIASDINPNPLENAEKTLTEEGLHNFIELRLSDGFKNIYPDEADEIAVAGMGGIMIAQMIDETEWLKDSKKHLVLQPMTHFENVRRALLTNGFEILEERTVSEGRRVYLVISAKYTGSVNEKPPYWFYFGDMLNSHNDSDIKFVAKMLKSLNKKYDGLLKSGVQDEELLQILRSVENAESN